MESLKIYEESRNELAKIAKEIATSSVTINMDKLDGITKNELTNALHNVISKRLPEIDATYLGVQNN